MSVCRYKAGYIPESVDTLEPPAMPAKSLQYPVGVEQPLLTLTRPKDTLWVIEMHHGHDNRLTETFIEKCLKPALDTVAEEWEQGWAASKEKGKAASEDEGKGALLIVGKKGQEKFFSNGLDFANAIKNPDFFPLIFNPLISQLVTFPIPTIAVINGHCFAAGMIFSLCCDYRIMTDGTKRNAWMCMNEVHFGAPCPASFAALLRAKVLDQQLHRKIALEGARFTPADALKGGFIDHIVPGSTADMLVKAEELAANVSGLAKGGVWGVIKRDLYSDVIEKCDNDLATIAAKARL